MMQRALFALCLVVWLPHSVHAQQRHHHPQPTAAKRPHKSAARHHPDKPAAAPAAAAAPKPADAAPKPAAADNHAARAADEDQDNVRKEHGTEVKTLEFSGLDIEGQLKTPQMLYFLNRLRAEFDRPQLPHRSFMPELQRSTKENVF